MSSEEQDVNKIKVDFAERVARVMDELRSSHVFFILEQAYPENEDWEWRDFQELIDTVKGEH